MAKAPSTDGSRKQEVVVAAAAAPAAATGSGPSSSDDLTVSDPMRDGAVFNQPLDETSLEASDFPMFENPRGHGDTLGKRDPPGRSSSTDDTAPSPLDDWVFPS